MRATRPNRLQRVVLSMANSLKLILVVYVASLIVAAVLLTIAEGRSFGDSLWWANVTATTVGYGDISPTTLVGRLIAGFFLNFWVLGITLLAGANVVVRVLRDDNQFSHAEQEWIIDSLQRIAKDREVELLPLPTDTEYGDLDTSA